MLSSLISIIGCLLIVGVTYLFSKNKKDINWISVGCAFIGQFILAFLLIKTPLWKGVEWMANGVNWLVGQSTEGIQFVFGGISENFVFFINSLLPIVFVSSLMGALFHFGILQKFISVIGLVVAKVLKVDTLVAVNGITNMFLGQSDSLFVTKSYLPKAKDSVVFATLCSGMTSVSIGVISLYASYGAEVEWIIASMPLTVIGTFVLTQIVYPTEYEDANSIEISMDDKGSNVLETMMNYANSGFKTVIGISVSLMVFLSVVSTINGLLGFINPSLSLDSILAIPFMPIAFLMGVDISEVKIVAEILSTKLVTNEAVAIALPQFQMLSENAKTMMTVALMGFAGISSPMILLAAFQTIAPNKSTFVSRVGFKALLIATLVNVMSAACVGVFL